MNDHPLMNKLDVFHPNSIIDFKTMRSYILSNGYLMKEDERKLKCHLYATQT